VRDRIILAGLRGTAVALLILALFRPTLIISSAVAQRNVLAVMLDDSRSMRLTDLGKQQTRLAAAQRVFADTTDLIKKLEKQYVLRYFRFAADARPVGSTSSLNGAGTRTDIGAALEGAREELSGTPVAGIVVVTDGADNGGSDVGTSLLALRARRIPVYTVGVGLERFPRDIAIERVAAPQNVLEGANVLIDAAIRVRGLGGQKTTVTVEADGRIVGSEDITLPASGDVTNARVRLQSLTPGTYRLTVRAKLLDGETIAENNEYHTVLRVRRGPERILYVEGEPRPEFGFMRRAVAPDTALQLVALLRSAEGKYLRLGVRDSLELVGGFPTSREELFKYPAIILGSLEANFFTGDQLRMLADFVSQRGGTLLALGGRSAFAEGGYGGTAVEEVLPLTFSRAVMDTAGPATEVRVRPTPAGFAHPALQLGANDSASAKKWRSLPPLTVVNGLGSVRPGATVLLTGRATTGQTDLPILAFQRFGRGVSAIFGVQDTWLWQMHADIAVDDETHETLWRQMLRWMLEGVPNQVEITALPARVGPGEPVTLRARVADKNYLDVNDAIVTATVTTPSGRSVNVPLEWSLREDGTYTGRFLTEEAGVYALSATSAHGRDTTKSVPGSLLADDQGADVEQAELRTPLLRRIAEETKGRYYPLADASKLLEDVKYTDSGVTMKESRDLWDLPVVLLALIVLLGAEWTYRRWRGLA
ncbi:MAG TPA: glutamine amidotransferase, partial [Gemmatimonadaceae bacterium]|nr:glutamine amidotransferase [Gemmatimonadaceae bacterium]